MTMVAYTTPECPRCGVWECLDCGVKASRRNRYFPGRHHCRTCKGTNGRMLPTHHRDDIHELHAADADPRAICHYPLEDSCPNTGLKGNPVTTPVLNPEDLDAIEARINTASNEDAQALLALARKQQELLDAVVRKAQDFVMKPVGSLSSIEQPGFGRGVRAAGRELRAVLDAQEISSPLPTLVQKQRAALERVEALCANADGTVVTQADGEHVPVHLIRAATALTTI